MVDEPTTGGPGENQALPANIAANSINVEDIWGTWIITNSTTTTGSLTWHEAERVGIQWTTTVSSTTMPVTYQAAPTRIYTAVHQGTPGRSYISQADAERVARDMYERNQRAQEQQRQLQAAEARAKELFRSLLTTEEWAQWERHHLVDIPVTEDRWWLITDCGYQGNLRIGAGRPETSGIEICAHARGRDLEGRIIPNYDQWAIQAMEIKANEAHLVQVGNPSLFGSTPRWYQELRGYITLQWPLGGAEGRLPSNAEIHEALPALRDLQRAG